MPGSSSQAFWPIFMSTSRNPRLVSVVGIFFDTQKPKPVPYLEHFVKELGELLEKGFNGCRVLVDFFTCDLQALCILKSIKAPIAYSCCPKCNIVGDRLESRQTFATIKDMRTDTSFRNREDPAHHNPGECVFERIPSRLFDVVESFTLDPMHEVFLNTFKRLIHFSRGQHSSKKKLLSEGQFDHIGNDYAKLNFPTEFNRRSRSFKSFEKFKATELRMLLLYGADVLFQVHITGAPMYIFQMLSMGIRILSDKRLYKVTRAP